MKKLLNTGGVRGAEPPQTEQVAVFGCGSIFPSSEGDDDEGVR